MRKRVRTPEEIRLLSSRIDLAGKVLGFITALIGLALVVIKLII